MESMNNYRVIRQLFYQNYITGSLLNTTSSWDPSWVSTAASSSGNETVYNFPTGSEEILIFTIPSQIFGEQISRKTFTISSSDSSYYIVDDGDGNLIDILSGNERVGNIFYAQGIAVITNQDYVSSSVDYLTTENNEIYQTENEIEIIIE
jgi:hypothetical protein